ncbi:MAG: hypothetical protein M3350_05440, partial [Actinomycetota bacterium]|nr:hypothetical protein [Actinomycetota bacterium]
MRVVVRRRAGVRTRVLLGRRDVTRRFRSRGRRLVGRLGRREGARLGRNHLSVVSRRRGKAAQRQGRSFFVLRRVKGLARVRVRGRNPARLQIDIVSRGSRARLARRPRAVRVRLNGRSLSKELIAPSGTRRTLTLSASHGLRHGLNRLRVVVAERRAGRYASFTRRFRVPRNRPLAAPGLDRGARPKYRLRLGGRHRAARGGRLRYRWTLVRRPRRSRARIRGRTAANPLLVPDRPGRYLARVRVSERKPGRASAARVGATVDHVAVTVGPSTGLVPFSANAAAVEPRGIQFGGAFFYHHPGPGASLQWLMVDRAGLTRSKTGSSWCCGSGDNSLASLSDDLDNAGLEELVVITLPPNRQSLDVSQYDEFNAALGKIGVNPLSADDLNKSDQQLVIVGIPSTPLGTGSVIRSRCSSISSCTGPGGTSGKDLRAQGWLMPDGDLSTNERTSKKQRFRLQPLRLPFNTSAKSTASSNTMAFAGQTVVSPSLPPGAEAGTHAVEVDPRDLSVGRNRSFGNEEADLDNLAEFIDSAR